MVQFRTHNFSLHKYVKVSRRCSRGDACMDVSEERTAPISHPADYARRNVAKFLRDYVELYRRIIFAP